MLFLSTPSARRATLYLSATGLQLRISIHALREEGDPPRRGSACMLPIFLSTPSARRATHHPRLRSGGQKISIHALREEGDQNSIALIESGKRFLSTPSARRATLTLYHADVLRLISIHALREEGDFLHFPHGMVHCDFYPRPPRGGRRLPARSRVSEIWHFYPRPPRGGRHMVVTNGDCFIRISIHALREEGDEHCWLVRVYQLIFLSTPSARRAT